MLGLAWRHVDLDAAHLVSHSAVRRRDYGERRRREDLQTSRRTIDLDPRTVAVLRAWRRHQLERSRAPVRRRPDDEFVFTRPDGGPIHPDFFSQAFDRASRDSELPTIRLHDLRHTHATILLKAGVPVKVVSERLGHSQPGLHDDRLPTRPPRHAGGCGTTFGDVVFGDH